MQCELVVIGNFFPIGAAVGEAIPELVRDVAGLCIGPGIRHNISIIASEILNRNRTGSRLDDVGAGAVDSLDKFQKGVASVGIL